MCRVVVFPISFVCCQWFFFRWYFFFIEKWRITIGVKLFSFSCGWTSCPYKCIRCDEGAFTVTNSIPVFVFESKLHFNSKFCIFSSFDLILQYFHNNFRVFLGNCSFQNHSRPKYSFLCSFKLRSVHTADVTNIEIVSNQYKRIVWK